VLVVVFFLVVSGVVVVVGLQIACGMNMAMIMPLAVIVFMLVSVAVAVVVLMLVRMFMNEAVMLMWVLMLMMVAVFMLVFVRMFSVHIFLHVLSLVECAECRPFRHPGLYSLYASFSSSGRTTLFHFSAILSFWSEAMGFRYGKPRLSSSGAGVSKLAARSCRCLPGKSTSGPVLMIVIKKAETMQIIKESKEFAVKGNVVDMAVGIIIGDAFGKIVSSLGAGGGPESWPIRSVAARLHSAGDEAMERGADRVPVAA